MRCVVSEVFLEKYLDVPSLLGGSQYNFTMFLGVGGWAGWRFFISWRGRSKWHSVRSPYQQDLSCLVSQLRVEGMGPDM